MNTQITYLFGAGASAEVLPVVEQMANSFNECLELINSQLDENHYQNRKELLFTFENNLNELIIKCDEHSSIDTYAKKLWILNDYQRLNNLKSTLVAYFTVMQLANGVDKRYDALVASLLKTKSLIIPKNIRFLSWNYDLQLELGFRGFTSDPELIHVQNQLQMIQKGGYINLLDSQYLKLNGSASFKNTKVTESVLSNSNQSNLIQLIIVVLTHYNKCHDLDSATNISFAWEDENSVLSSLSEKSTIDHAKDIAKKTDILIVIGYSFPFFNRDIDRAIFEDMINLKKVYVQTKEDAAAAMMQKIYSVKKNWNSIVVEPYTDVKQFLIPNEL